MGIQHYIYTATNIILAIGGKAYLQHTIYIRFILIVARPRKFLVNKHGNWKVVKTHPKGNAIKEHGKDYSDTEKPAAKGKKKGYGTEEAVVDTKAPPKKEKGNGT